MECLLASEKTISWGSDIINDLFSDIVSDENISYA